MKLNEMKQILASGEIRLTKSLGQNFLHDANQLRRIVRAADLCETDRVLEIGPGLGPLTHLLLEIVPRVVAIELDRRLVEFLQNRFRDRTNLTLFHADALEFLRATNLDLAGWKVVSNLPFSVASPILVELAKSAGRPDRMAVTLQLEVAEKLMSKAGESEYGILTLLIGLQYRLVNWFKVPARCFFPVPDVDSACVTLEKRREMLLPVELGPVFEKVVKRSFSQRRKMMFKLLRDDWPVTSLRAAFSEVGLAESVRAESVTLEQFAGLTQRLHPIQDAGQ